MWMRKVPLGIHKGYLFFFHLYSSLHPFTVLTPFQFLPSWNKISWPQGLTSFSSWRTAVSAVSLASCHLMLRNHADNYPSPCPHKLRDNLPALHQMPPWRKRKSMRIFLYFRMGRHSFLCETFQESRENYKGPLHRFANFWNSFVKGMFKCYKPCFKTFSVCEVNI